MEAALERPVHQEIEHDTTSSVAEACGPALSAEDDVRTSLELLSSQRKYNRWIFDRVRPFVGERVCEVGCGIGNILEFMLDCREVVGIEPSADSFGQVQARLGDRRNVRFANCFLSDCPRDDVPAESFDTVLCLNVLQEVEDDLEAVRTMRKLVRPNGRVVVLVPAHMALFGSLDRTYGFYRRYSRSSLAGVFEAADLRPLSSSYSNVLGFFGWWWFSRCLRRKELTAGSTGLFDKFVPLLALLERITPPPFGQSLIMAGTRHPRGQRAG
ncbi:MAG: class I SAM-dependent methyltransferase [Phycisphaerales bacterium]|nr:MAG: class I SAM-dependent methyltransferase [Phycisphaerales bacterium]